MSETQQDAAEATGIPAVPGHQGGPPLPTEPDPKTREADEAGAGHPDGIEPRAGRD